MAQRLLSYHALGRNTGTPRLWLENHRLSLLGFTPNTRFNITEAANGRRLVIEAAPNGTNTISERKSTPILDICSASKLASLQEYKQVKVMGTNGRLDISASLQAFFIARSKRSIGTIRVLELCAGGGTMHTAIARNPHFEIVAAAEYVPTYASEYARKHPETQIIIGDIRKIHTNEYPDFDALVAGFPCTDFSNLGRAKKGLAGRPEAGTQADVFLPVMSLVAARMPRAVVLENVPSVASSHTAMTIRSFLTNLGYHIDEQVFDANTEFGDIQARRRWCLVATLKPGFRVVAPGIPCSTRAGDFLDPENPEQDQVDASRIANTIAGLDYRIIAHREKGNGFGYSVINPDETKIATLTKCMHKINQGPFVRTPYGLRMPRKSEIERIADHQVLNDSYRVACEVIGQGISIRMFQEIFRQLGNFLLDENQAPAPSLPTGQLEFFT